MKRNRILYLTATVCVAICMVTCMTACSTTKTPELFTTKIRGTVVDRPDSKMLLLNRLNEDSRVSTTEIPIVDGKFEYDLISDSREMWNLVFADEMQQGGFRPITFFSEPGCVSMTLHPIDRFQENLIDGGKLNTEYAALMDSIKVWSKTKSEQGEKLIERGYKPENRTRRYNPETNTGEIIVERSDISTPEGRALHEEYLALERRTMPGRLLDYHRNNPSPVSLALLYRSIDGYLRWGEDMAKPYIDIYNEVGYAAKYPDSPYTLAIANLLGAAGTLKVGGSYFDFTLPDLEGNRITISEHIAGNVALIDLWMTWCGPCRRRAIEAIPIYEEFKNRGFTVIGVNGDGDLDGIKKAVESDGYRWPTLVDLKGENGVWNKYGIDGSGGASYLVDRDGTILAVNPSKEQLITIVAEKLN